ncbi:hypothetical protein [Nocardioides lianchengensis]|uniref:Uncharacterized protein n=1 Tax=Nocardioides lianchengensis TaxID=1045774 RepID=A0A1G6L8T8_9ACTN|nr:hypothetical protein [Nocardioides lianchengensis]NYG12641.1 hypothetical protein [Nocardioides lianchengensis]SDC39674.1 hypothetical protein SAMN05421872_102160 [Nocardioides lianchengensis]
MSSERQVVDVGVPLLGIAAAAVWLAWFVVPPSVVSARVPVIELVLPLVVLAALVVGTVVAVLETRGRAVLPWLGLTAVLTASFLHTLVVVAATTFSFG